MKLFYLVLVFTVFTISCARPTARDVDSGKQKLNRVITFIESRQSENLESLTDTDELRKLYETESGKNAGWGIQVVLLYKMEKCSLVHFKRQLSFSRGLVS